MKCLVIAPQPFFSPRGTPFSVYYRTLVTSELGIEVDLLTYGQGQDVDLPQVRIIRIPPFNFLGKIKIGPSPLKLFLDFILFFKALGLLIRHRYDFVHAHEEAVFFCLALKPFFRFKLVYDMHSSLPQQLTNFEFTTSKLLIGFFKKLEDLSLKKADAIITICPDLANYVDKLLGKTEKHFLIENSLFDPIRLKSVSSGSDNHEEPMAPVPDGRRCIVYAGTLEPYQGVDLLIRAFSTVLKKAPDAFLLIAGGTAAQGRQYETLAHELGLKDNCLFTGTVPPATAKKYIAQAAVLVSCRISGTNTPLKIYEQLASGIPLVATAIYSHTQVLDNTVAILVQPDPDDMARGLLRALGDEGKTIAIQARQLYDRDYSRPTYEAKMRNLFRLLKKCAA